MSEKLLDLCFDDDLILNELLNQFLNRQNISHFLQMAILLRCLCLQAC